MEGADARGTQEGEGGVSEVASEKAGPVVGKWYAMHHLRSGCRRVVRVLRVTDGVVVHQEAGVHTHASGCCVDEAEWAEVEEPVKKSRKKKVAEGIG